MIFGHHYRVNLIYFFQNLQNIGRYTDIILVTQKSKIPHIMVYFCQFLNQIYDIISLLFHGFFTFLSHVKIWILTKILRVYYSVNLIIFQELKSIGGKSHHVG